MSFKSCMFSNTISKMEKFKIFAMSAVVMLAAAACSSGGKKIPGRGMSGEKAPVTVKVMEVSETAAAGVNGYVGTAKAAKSAFIGCPFPGKLVSLNVSEGEKIESGQVLAVIESQSVKSSYDMALATLKQAEDGYERVMKVHSSGSVPDVKMVEARTQLAKARSAAEAAEKAMEDCRIKAPYDAVVSDIYVDPGMELGLMDKIARVVDVSTVEIHFPVPENEIGGIAAGMTVRVEIPAIDAGVMSGKIVSKGVEASPLSHTYECIMVLDRHCPALKPGMVCKVFMDTDAAEGFVIPASVVRTDVSGRYVWTVSDAGIVCKTHVSVSGFSGEGVVVGSGLSQGDRIISEGMQKVCTGMKVKTTE